MGYEWDNMNAYECYFLNGIIMGEVTDNMEYLWSMMVNDGQ